MVKLLPRGDFDVLLNVLVALDDVDVDVAEKALRALQDVVRLLQKRLHLFAHHRPRRVNRDDELADALHVLVFQRLNERHPLFGEKLHPVAVKHIVELIVIDAHGLAHHGEFLQERRVVVLFPVDGAEILHHAACLVAALLVERLQVGLHLLGNVLPVLQEGG